VLGKAADPIFLNNLKIVNQKFRMLQIFTTLDSKNIKFEKFKEIKISRILNANL
jgi:hypothetical protein